MMHRIPPTYQIDRVLTVATSSMMYKTIQYNSHVVLVIHGLWLTTILYCDAQCACVAINSSGVSCGEGSVTKWREAGEANQGTEGGDLVRYPSRMLNLYCINMCVYA